MHYPPPRQWLNRTMTRSVFGCVVFVIGCVLAPSAVVAVGPPRTIVALGTAPITLDGSLEEPHEHEWHVVATFRSGVLDEPMGVVIDFVEVENALADIARELEGSNLNALEAFSDEKPSAERVARHVAGLLAERLARGDLLHRVRVTEARGCSAAYYP